MAKKEAADLAYIKTLGELRKIIDTEYKDGGRLPASREMCSRMNVNRNTYGKAIARLVIDGYARNYKQNGIYITPYRFRCHKIGLILGRGEDCPFIPHPDVITHALDEITKFNYQAQIIQAASTQQILRKAILHGVNSLIWFYPHDNLTDVCNTALEIIEDGRLPIIMVQLHDTNTETTFAENIPHISRDYSNFGKNRADFYIERDHKSVAFIGPKWFGDQTGFYSHLNANGVKVNENFPISGVENINNNLEEYLRKEEVTGLFLEGPTEQMHCALEIMSDLHLELNIRDIIIRAHNFSDEIIKDFPELKGKLGVEYSSSDTANIALSTMIDYLDRQIPLESKKIPIFQKIKI